MTASEALAMHLPVAELQLLHWINRFVTNRALVHDGLSNEFVTSNQFKESKLLIEKYSQKINEQNRYRTLLTGKQRRFALRKASVNKASLEIAAKAKELVLG